MGWGTIISGGADGRYTLRLDFGKAQRDAWLASIDGWIADLNIQIANAEAAMIVTRDKAAEAKADLQTLLEDLASASEGQTAELQARIDIATQKFALAQAAADAARIPRDLMMAERTTLAKRKNDLQSAVVERTLQAWCADFTEDASGYVATLEIPGEDRAVLIAPGGRQPTAADGTLMARELMTPEQAFLNAALLPGWQKWKPTYRAGTITWLNPDANLANVTLDAATSSAAGLQVNQSPQLNGIPVRYMDCDATAFSVGDRVVVEFQGQQWTAPRVIGFVESPKQCTWFCRGSDLDAFIEHPIYGTLKYTYLVLECLIPGLIDSILAITGVEVFARFNGGPAEAVPRVGPEGSEPYPWLYQVMEPGTSGNDNWIRLDLSFFGGSTESIGSLGPMPHGGLRFVPAHRAIGNNTNTQSPGERWDFVEVVVKVAGKTVLDFAVEEMWDETSTRIAGVPIKISAGQFFTVSKLPGFVLQGA